MLISNGYILWLAGVVIVLAIASLVALFTRDYSPVEPARPVVLSDEDRLLLQGMAFEARKQGREEVKKQQQRLARKGKDQSPSAKAVRESDASS